MDAGACAWVWMLGCGDGLRVRVGVCGSVGVGGWVGGRVCVYGCACGLCFFVFLFMTRSNDNSGQSTARRTSARPRPTHKSHARVGAMTIHHPDWMDRHSGGSRQDTHGTLGPVRGQAVGGSSHVHRARHQVYLHNMAAEHDTTHWCQNGRPTQELAGD